MHPLPQNHASAWRSLSFFLRRHVLRQAQLTATIAALDLRVRAYSRDFTGRHLYKRGTYEPELTEYVFRHLPLRDDAVILDIGANLGWYSMLLARRSPHFRIHAFEPEPRNLALLRQNLQQNAITNVTVHAVAVAERNGTMQLFPYHEKNMGRHSLVPQSGCAPIDVQTVVIDELLEAQRIPPDAVDFVKIDVEGYELPALRGAAKLLAARPVVLAEFAPKYMRRAGTEPKAFLDLMQSHGFSAHQFVDGRLVPASFGAAAITNERLDLIYLKA